MNNGSVVGAGAAVVPKPPGGDGSVGGIEMFEHFNDKIEVAQVS